MNSQPPPDPAEIPARLLSDHPALHTDEAFLAETIRAVVDAGDTVGRGQGRALRSLQAVRAALLDAPDARAVELGEVLGSGGMGEVLQGFQPALRRPVAVKRLHGSQASGVAQLLREAWVAGYLEHPNILPVHDLAGGVDDPLLVMKLIEGVPWSEALDDPARATGGPTPEDPLRWQLEVLLEVCRAVRFAHARGVVHLDLKPANVMLGRFGEVYLVDWGLAATFGAHAPAWLPRVRELDGLVGTPVYMAPEQAKVEPALIGPATDVFQLGGILYELVTGQRPRLGSPLRAALMASRGELPDLAALPPGLAEICARAMAYAPADRYPDAGAFAAALGAYLQHREAERLAWEGARRLRTLREETPRQPAAVERLGTECAFAFEQALRIWPESPAALAGRLDLVRWQVARDLDSGSPEAAEAHLARLSAPPAALLAEVARAKAERAAREAAAEALRRAHDGSIGRQARVRWLWGIAALWVVWNLACGLIDRHLRPFDYPVLTGMSLSTFLVYLGGRRMAAAHLDPTPFNRRAVGIIGVGLGMICFFWFAAWSLGLSPQTAVALSSALYLLFGGLVAVLIDPRLWWAVAALVPLVGAASLWPAYAFEWVGLAGGACAAAGALVWSRPGPTGA